MTAPMLRPTGQAAAETELLAQLGLPASASPEDVDQLHQAVSDFLAAAPPEIRGWARAQVAALDAAYIHLDRPGRTRGLGPQEPGESAGGRTRRAGDTSGPPGPRPGGGCPGRSPAAGRGGRARDRGRAQRRGPRGPLRDGHPQRARRHEAASEAGQARRAPPRRAPPRRPLSAPPPRDPRPHPNIWKRLVLGGVARDRHRRRSPSAPTPSSTAPRPAAIPAASQVAQATSGAPAVDEAKVADLMAKFQADPKDIETLLALANEYYAGGAVRDRRHLAGQGPGRSSPSTSRACSPAAPSTSTSSTSRSAESTWKKVAVHRAGQRRGPLRPGLPLPQPAHPGLGRRPGRVEPGGRARPDSDLAKTVQSHLDVPGRRLHAPRAARPAPRAAPAASPAASPGRIPAGLPGGEHRPVIELGSALGIGIAFLGGARVVRVPLLPAARPGLHLLHGGRDR